MGFFSGTVSHRHCTNNVLLVGFYCTTFLNTSERFFSDCGVYNHCPLMYMAASGKNVTPADMKAAHREEILQVIQCQPDIKSPLP